MSYIDLFIYLFTRLVRMTSYKSELCSHYKSHVLQNLSLPFLPALRLWAWVKRGALVRPWRSSPHHWMNPAIVFILIIAAITDAVIDFLDWSWRWRLFGVVSIDQRWVLVSGLTQVWDIQRVKCSSLTDLTSELNCDLIKLELDQNNLREYKWSLHDQAWRNRLPTLLKQLKGSVWA